MSETNQEDCESRKMQYRNLLDQVSELRKFITKQIYCNNFLLF